MNIDLLFTNEYEAGLISDANLVKKAAGVLLDTQSGLMTLEYVDMDFDELNIPVDDDFIHMLGQNTHLHIGAVKNGNIAQAYQIPLMMLNDPYRGQKLGRPQTGDNPLWAFEVFIRNTINGQPVHRDNLGDEDTVGCVLGDAMPSALQFAPHLAQQRSLEAAPKAQPTFTPSGPAGPGLGSGGGGGTVRRGGNTQNPQNNNRKNRDDD